MVPAQRVAVQPPPAPVAPPPTVQTADTSNVPGIDILTTLKQLIFKNIYTLCSAQLELYILVTCLCSV